MRLVRVRYVILTLAAVVALVLVSDSVGRSQPPARAGIVSRFAPPAIDRGLMSDRSVAPDSPESRVRASVRALDAPAVRHSASGATYVPGRLIVKFRDGVSVSTRSSTLSAMSARASSRPSYADFDLVAIDPAMDAEVAANALAARNDVEYAQPVHLVHALMTPNDTFYSMQWNLPDIDMPRAWDIQPSAGSSVTVAVLDTGVAFTSITMRYHANAFVVDSSGDVVSSGPGTVYPALGDLTLPFVAAPELAPSTRFVAPADLVWNSTLPLDFDGHGTHVTGTIGQATNNSAGVAGVAFNVRIMPVKVLASEWDVIFGAAPEVGGTDDVLARGIRYAADNGAKVINMSLGETGPAGSAPAVEAAIRYAVGKGAFVVVAGGNEFEEGNPNEVLSEIASRIPGAVSVAAVDRGHQRAYYSSTGTYVELAAPGGSFRGFGADGGILQQTLFLDLVDTFTLPVSQFGAPRFDAFAYYYFTGTSQAAPHVSGVAAMLIQQGITSPAAVESALERSAIDPASRAQRGGVRDNDFGFGEVSARNALFGLGLAR